VAADPGHAGYPAHRALKGASLVFVVDLAVEHDGVVLHHDVQARHVELVLEWT